MFLVAAQLRLERVAWSSSETTLGLPFDVPPFYAPIDEDHFPYPTTTYTWSKVVGETLAAQVSEWSGIPFVGLRFSNIHAVTDYERLPSYWMDRTTRSSNLWGYVDDRDVAYACRLALEAPLSGAHNFIIAAADTIMNRPSIDLLNVVFPGTPLKKEVAGLETLPSGDQARSLLGYEPRHSWRNHIADA